MDIWTIRGGRRLEGELRVQGSKNASLPMLAAALLCPGQLRLENVPGLRDVESAEEILASLGCRTAREEGRVTVDASALSACAIERELMGRMRSSVIFLGPLLARCGEAQIYLPGGCRLGPRPIDLHLAALRALGAQIEADGDRICCRPAKLRGAEICLPFPSVGATENTMLAACGAEGETIIRGAAREPEISALQETLRAMGAWVYGAGSDTIHILGRRRLRPGGVRVPADRIAAASFCCAVAGTGGDIRLKNCDPTEISAVLHFLDRAGCAIMTQNGALRVQSSGRPLAVGEVSTAPYPGFPTDAQPLLMAALLRSRGESRFVENIYEDRFRHVPALQAMGADICVEGRCARLRGSERLHGAAAEATDLRGGAAMLLAGLQAEGETRVCDAGHIRRGYASLDRELRALGADLSLQYEGEDDGESKETQRVQR